jgi:hypothetical protein
MNTEVTFLDHTGNWIRESHIIRTGCSTIVATDTAVGINQNNTVFLPLIGGPYRAYGITDRAIAVITQPGEKKN